MSVETSFQKLGLGEYESRALAALISHHDSTAEMISDLANIPYTKIYQILNALEKQGLVKSTLERPKKYRPLDPENIVGSILERRKDEFKDLEKELKSDLKEMKKNYEQGELYQGKEKVWYLPNEKAVFEECARYVKNSKKNLKIIADSPMWLHVFTDQKIQEAMHEAVKRGVKAYEIYPKSLTIKDIPQLGLKTFCHNNNSARIVDDKDIFNTMLISDEKRIGLSFKDPKTGGVSSGLSMEDELIARGSEDHFSRVWNSALPIEDIIRQEAKKALQQIERISAKN